MLKNSEIKTAHGGRRDTPYGTQPALLKNLEAKIAHGGRSLTDPNFEHLWTCGWEPGLPGIPRSGKLPEHIPFP